MTEPVKIAVILGGSSSNFRILSAGAPVEFVVVDLDDAEPGEHDVEITPDGPAHVTRGSAELDGPGVLALLEPATIDCGECEGTGVTLSASEIDRTGHPRHEVCPVCDGYCTIPAPRGAVDDDGCPVDDPECLSSNEDRHDACVAPTPRTYTIDIWEGESIWTYEGSHTNAKDAQEAARVEINNDWHGTDDHYPSWADLVRSVDGHAIVEHPDVMGERLPLDTLMLYRHLADGLHDMVDGDRLTREHIPADFGWLFEQLGAIATADPGDAVLPPHMPRECRTCAEAIETRAAPCDECGTVDEGEEDSGQPDTLSTALRELLVDQLGFVPELIGGGCHGLRSISTSGLSVFITAEDGAGYPEADSWMIGVYPPGDDAEALAVFSSAEEPRLDFNHALNVALIASAPNS